LNDANDKTAAASVDGEATSNKRPRAASDDLDLFVHHRHPATNGGSNEQTSPQLKVRVKLEPTVEDGVATSDAPAAKRIRLEETEDASVAVDPAAAVITENGATANGSSSNERITIKAELGLPDIVDLETTKTVETHLDVGPPSAAIGRSNNGSSQRSTIKIEPGNMPEIIDLDEIPDDEIKLEDQISGATRNPKSKTAELLKLEEEERKLTEDIEEAERLVKIAKMKRKREELQAKIEVARGETGK
jgi:hypothetical protein